MSGENSRHFISRATAGMYGYCAHMKIQSARVTDIHVNKCDHQAPSMQTLQYLQ